MALDSVTEGEPVGVVVDRLLYVESLSDQRRAKCQKPSNYGYSGTGAETLNNASNTPKKIHENKGGTGPITAYDEASVSLDVRNQDGKTVGEGVIRRTATNTSYPDECKLINPPTTTRPLNYLEEGESTLVEYNLPVNYFVVMSVHKVPLDRLLSIDNLKTLPALILRWLQRAKHAARTSKVIDTDLAFAPKEIVITWQTDNEKDAQNLVKMFAHHFRDVLKPKVKDAYIHVHAIGVQDNPAMSRPVTVWDYEKRLS
jgi:hypothetical protein